MASCAGPSLPSSDIEASNPYGVSDADYEQGAATEQAQIRACMEEAGWPYNERDPDDIVHSPSERGVAWGFTASLLEAMEARTSNDQSNPSGDISIPETVRPQDTDAWMSQATECSNNAEVAMNARRDSVSRYTDRLDQAWEEFRQSSEYQAAIKVWSTCMSEHGYEIEHPDEASAPITSRLKEMTDAAESDITQIDRSDVLQLQQQEIALYEASEECRAETIGPLEHSFKRNLLVEEAEAVASIRRAIRGD